MVVAAFYVVMPETFAKIRIDTSMELSFVLIFNACSFFRLGDFGSHFLGLLRAVERLFWSLLIGQLWRRQLVFRFDLLFVYK